MSESKTKQSIIPELTQEEFDKLPRAHKRRLYKVYHQINQVKYFTEQKGDGRNGRRHAKKKIVGDKFDNAEKLLSFIQNLGTQSGVSEIK